MGGPIPAAQLAVQAGDVRVLHPVEPGWWHVTERLNTCNPARALRWDVVAPEAIESSIEFRWDNYPKALAVLGGRNPEAAEDAMVRARARHGPTSASGFSCGIRSSSASWA